MFRSGRWVFLGTVTTFSSSFISSILKLNGISERFDSFNVANCTSFLQSSNSGWECWSLSWMHNLVTRAFLCPSKSIRERPWERGFWVQSSGICRASGKNISPTSRLTIQFADLKSLLSVQKYPPFRLSWLLKSWSISQETAKPHAESIGNRLSLTIYFTSFKTKQNKTKQNRKRMSIK